MAQRWTREQLNRIQTQFARLVTDKVVECVKALLVHNTAFTTLLMILDTLFKRNEYMNMTEFDKYKVVMSFSIDFIATFPTQPKQWGMDKWDEKITKALNSMRR